MLRTVYLEHGLCLIKHCGFVFSSSSCSSCVAFNGVELVDDEQRVVSGMTNGERGDVEVEQQRSSYNDAESLSWFDEHDDWSRWANGLK